MATSTQASVQIPDTLAGWPWNRQSNPFTDLVRSASMSWIFSFDWDAVDPDIRKSRILERTDIRACSNVSCSQGSDLHIMILALLTSLAYPFASPGQSGGVVFAQKLISVIHT